MSILFTVISYTVILSIFFKKMSLTRLSENSLRLINLDMPMGLLCRSSIKGRSIKYKRIPAYVMTS